MNWKGSILQKRIVLLYLILKLIYYENICFLFKVHLILKYRIATEKFLNILIY